MFLQAETQTEMLSTCLRGKRRPYITALLRYDNGGTEEMTAFLKNRCTTLFPTVNNNSCVGRFTCFSSDECGENCGEKQVN